MWFKWFFMTVGIYTVTCLFSETNPIGFSIHESKIVEEIPIKTQDFSNAFPADFENERDYYEDYQKSYFAFTKCKNGESSLRYCEILANGCVPYFLDLEQCNDEMLFYFPKNLIVDAMHLKGVSKGTIDHSIFDYEQYFMILQKLLEYTRRHLTTKAMVAQLLKKMNYSGQGKILFLSRDTTPEYMRCTILIGLKDILGDKVIDYPKVSHVYKNYIGNPSQLPDKGFSYTKMLDDPFIRRHPDIIKNAILRRKYELIIYGSVNRDKLWHDLVKARYSIDKIAYISP